MDEQALQTLLGGWGEQQAAAFVLVLARLAPLFILAPLFSSKLIPTRARMTAALALALGLSPVAHPHGVIPTDALGLSWLIGKELLVGFAFSFSLGALFAAFQAAGSLIDTLIGFSFGSLVDPLTGTQSSILAQLYAMVAVMVFIAVGGDGYVIEGLAKTYDLVPMLGSPSVSSIEAGAMQSFSTVFTSALEVCAPVLVALVITDAAFGVVAKVVPQLNVFAVGFPAKVAVGLLVMSASLPFVAGWLGDGIQDSVRNSLVSLG